MQAKNEQQCFEQAEHEEEIQEVLIPKNGLLGQANPIYSKKVEQTDIDYDGSIALKILPSLDYSQIQNYSSFKLSHNPNPKNPQKHPKQPKKNSQPQTPLSLANTKLLLTQPSNPFNRFYSTSEVVYCKFNNTRHNVYKDVVYFAGIFVPRDVIAGRFRLERKDERRELGCNIGAILHRKEKEKDKQREKGDISTFISSRNSLIFDSNFQSGNLFAAFRKTSHYNQYDLILNNDINSKGSIQWFYFSLQGLEPGLDYTFNIVNFTKNDSLFNYGMRPAFYSTVENAGHGPGEDGDGREGRVGWYRFGRDVEYAMGEIPRENNANKFYYTLRFTINWKYPNDKLYIAHSFPYTHTRILNLTRRLMQRGQQQKDKSNPKKPKPQAHNQIQQLKLGKTLTHRDLHIYLISPPKKPVKAPRQAILIMARQHPGETQGSFVCEGILRELVESSGKEVRFLLENYLVYVVPMVNVDGVVFGNYRTNLSGKDLNRKWDTTDVNSSLLHTPQIVAIKEFIANLVKSGTSLRFVLDLHGHSKKFNSFFYGNPSETPSQTKIFPYICSRYSQAIQFMDCTFAAESYKKKAARIYLSSLYQQPHVYTFESSFYGYRNRQGKVVEFTGQEFFKLGQALLKGLYLLLYREKSEDLLGVDLARFADQVIGKQAVPLETYIKFENQLKENQLLLRVGDAESSGSESKPEEGQLNNDEIVYQSDGQQQVDQRVIVQSKPSNKSTLIPPNEPPSCQPPKTKSIRINSRKTTHPHPHPTTIEYKELGKQYRNKKLITISQVNGVLADKYHISLVPIERVAYRMGRKADAQVQTEKWEREKMGRVYKGWEIEEKGGLVGWLEDGVEEESSATYSFNLSSNTNSKQSNLKNPPKKHAQIVAQIQRNSNNPSNSRHINYRQTYQTEKDLINRRKPSLKQPSLQPQPHPQLQSQTRDKASKKQHRYTQTIVTFKCGLPKGTDNKFLNPIQKQGENQARIAQMEKINRDVLRIYSKKSTVVDISLKPKLERSSEKNYKQGSMEKREPNFFNRQ